MYPLPLGFDDGAIVGDTVGIDVGEELGINDGAVLDVGRLDTDGVLVGEMEGEEDGIFVGSSVIQGPVVSSSLLSLDIDPVHGFT